MYVLRFATVGQKLTLNVAYSRRRSNLSTTPPARERVLAKINTNRTS